MHRLLITGLVNNDLEMMPNESDWGLIFGTILVAKRRKMTKISTMVRWSTGRGFNHLKPTGHVTHHQFNIQQLYALPTLYLCVLYLSENKQRLVPLTA